MQNESLLNFTFIANFRGGTYCSQVKATDVEESVSEWIKQLSIEQDEIKYLGDKVIEDLKKESSNDDNKFVPLTGLKNIWNTIYFTRMGSFDLYVIQTDTR